MKTILKYTLMLLLTGYSFMSKAQQGIVPLKIGDKIPDVILRHLIGSQNKVKLTDLTNQDLLIINFWATWCVPCVRELPHLNSIVKNNQGRVKVLCVAYENSTVINAFLKRHQEMDLSHVILMTNDTLLGAYFKHIMVPHNIWIDRGGIIRYVSGDDEMLDDNIISFLKNKSPSIHNKIDVTNFDIWKPFHLKDSVFIYRSILTSYIDGIFSGCTTAYPWKHPTEHWFDRFFCYNLSRESLFWRAINRLESNYNYFGTMKIITQDSTRFFWPTECPKTFSKSKYKSKFEWENENAFCYELLLPHPEKDTLFFANMLNDLKRMFQVDVYTQMEIMPTCVLTIKNGKHFNAAMDDSTYIDTTGHSLKAHNVNILSLYEYINETIKPDKNAKPADPPFIDQTGLKSRVDVDIQLDKNTPFTSAAVKAAIKVKYGLLYKIEKRPYPVTIVKDLVP